MIYMLFKFICYNELNLRHFYSFHCIFAKLIGRLLNIFTHLLVTKLIDKLLQIFIHQIVSLFVPFMAFLIVLNYR